MRFSFILRNFFTQCGQTHCQFLIQSSFETDAFRKFQALFLSITEVMVSHPSVSHAPATGPQMPVQHIFFFFWPFAAWQKSGFYAKSAYISGDFYLYSHADNKTCQSVFFQICMNETLGILVSPVLSLCLTNLLHMYYDALVKQHPRQEAQFISWSPHSSIVLCKLCYCELSFLISQ